MLPRPRFRIPLWVAVALVAAVYVARSASRGMDFRLDWPADAVALGLFLVIVVMVAYVRNVIAREGDPDGGSNSRHDEGEDAHPGEDSNLPLG